MTPLTPKVLLLCVFAACLSACNSATPSNRETMPVTAETQSPTPTATPIRTAAEYLSEGAASYDRGEYDRAIPPLRRAREMEKDESTLSADAMERLIFDLADSLEKTGNVEAARVVLVDGISLEPYHAMFHYRLAETFGPEGDEDEAIKYLRYAYEYRLNVSKGENVPDALTDKVFDGLPDRQRFVTVVGRIEKDTPDPKASPTPAAKYAKNAK